MRLLTSAAIVIIAFVSLLQAQASERDQNVFSISGYVLDVNGKPMAGAEVHARLLDRGGLEQSSYTQFGKFTLSVEGPGSYMVFCSKDDQGYKDISEALLKLDPEGIPTVVVTKESPKQVTVIRLRSSAAKLRIKLIDSVTGNPLEKAQLVIRRDDRPTMEYTRPLISSFDKNGEIKLILPTLPLRLQVSALGYENWAYREPNAIDQKSILLLGPGETREITVALTLIKRAQ